MKDHDCCCGGNQEHEHGHNCGCGEEHDHHHHGEEWEVDVLRLTLDDGKQLECYVLGIYEVQGKDYIALLSSEDERVLLYEYTESEEGIELSNIEDDAIFEEVARVFRESEEEAEEGEDLE